MDTNIPIYAEEQPEEEVIRSPPLHVALLGKWLQCSIPWSKITVSLKTHHLKIAEFVIPLKIKKLKEGSYLATSTVLRGLVAEGRSLAETMEIAQDVARRLIESHLDHGDPLPAGLKKFMKKGSFASVQVPIAVNY